MYKVLGAVQLNTKCVLHTQKRVWQDLDMFNCYDYSTLHVICLIKQEVTKSHIIIISEHHPRLDRTF